MNSENKKTGVINLNRWVQFPCQICSWYFKNNHCGLPLTVDIWYRHPWFWCKKVIAPGVIAPYPKVCWKVESIICPGDLVFLIKNHCECKIIISKWPTGASTQSLRRLPHPICTNTNAYFCRAIHLTWYTRRAHLNLIAPTPGRNYPHTFGKCALCYFHFYWFSAL